MMTTEKPTPTTPASAPRDVAAWFTLDSVSARTPWWAAQWLADGHDGEALREMAGLNGFTREPGRAGRTHFKGPHRQAGGQFCKAASATCCRSSHVAPPAACTATPFAIVMT
ncbi:hypothetical protein GCM10010121_099720 [Streptomyces brasiliensis]|uniref:Uncharacterized protein n=1 Tax=Streptomyces brasiliensis TaxID=1954 RepID=A0A917PEK6_9ACTN|nr:hypothetical protein GCM10010121_099720 [Streptomyces brasiliensis]